jgi:hypothetical protein
VENLRQLWQWVFESGDQLRVLASVVAILDGIGLVSGTVRWLRKKDIGTTTRKTYETVKTAEELARESSERLVRLEAAQKRSEEVQAAVLQELQVSDTDRFLAARRADAERDMVPAARG